MTDRFRSAWRMPSGVSVPANVTQIEFERRMAEACEENDPAVVVLAWNAALLVETRENFEPTFWREGMLGLLHEIRAEIRKHGTAGGSIWEWRDLWAFVRGQLALVDSPPDRAFTEEIKRWREAWWESSQPPLRKDKARVGRVRAEFNAMRPYIRPFVLAAYDHCCAMCGRPDFAGDRLHIDHIMPIARGGTNEPTNLRPLCRRCNWQKRTGA